MIRARTTVAIKQDAEKVFDQLGLTPTQAISLFYRQVSLRRGLPFVVEVPIAIRRAPARGREIPEVSVPKKKKKRAQARKG